MCAQECSVVWDVTLVWVISCVICLLLVVEVLRHILMGSVWVASIAYAAGSSTEMIPFVCWEEVSFLA